MERVGLDSYCQELIFYEILRIFYHYIPRARLKLHPTLPSIPLLGNFTLLSAPELHKTLHSYTQQYGPIFYIHIFRQKYLVINSSILLREILNRDQSSDRTHEYAAQRVSYNRNDIGFTDMDEKWSKMRRLGSKSLFTSTKQFDDLFVHEAMELMEKLNRCDGRSYEDVISQVHTDTVTHMLTGAHMREVRDEIRHFNKDWLECTAPGFACELDSFPFLRWLPWLQSNRKLSRFYKMQRSIISCITEKSTANSSGFPSVLSHLASLYKTNGLPEETFSGTTQTFLVAGIETVREALTQLIKLLAQNPEVQEKIAKELETVVGNKTPCLQDKENLPFLNASILETLRYVTVVPMVRRLTKAQINVDGHTIPKGTQMLVNFWAAHHDSNVWEAPELFKPQRFLDENGGLMSVDSSPRKMLLSFGCGRRQCLGEVLAKRRLFLQTAILLHNLQFTYEHHTSKVILRPRECSNKHR